MHTLLFSNLLTMPCVFRLSFAPVKRFFRADCLLMRPRVSVKVSTTKYQLTKIYKPKLSLAGTIPTKVGTEALSPN